MIFFIIFFYNSYLKGTSSLLVKLLVIMIIQGDIIIVSNSNVFNKNKELNIIDIIDIIDKSLLTITLPLDNEIYYSIDNKILNIIILAKKDKKLTSSPLSIETKIVNIPYGECTKYVLLNLRSTQTAISKKVKKTLLDYIPLNLATPTTLYMFNNSNIVNIDGNGYISYYPDTMEIYDINTISNFIGKEYPKNNTTFIPSLESILEGFNYKQVNINLNSNTYILDNLGLSSSNTTTNTNSNNNSNSNINTNNIISTLSNLISWFNPLSYYSSTTSNDKENISNTNGNVAIPISTKYYIAESNITSISNSLHIIKLENNKIKVLRPVQMLFPVYVENISLDNHENIILTGKINDIDKHISITYNKFLHNPSISILE